MGKETDKLDSKTIESTSRKASIRLKEILKEKHLTQAKLAEMIGLQEGTISAIVCGKRKLTSKTALRISSLFEDVPAPWLLGYINIRTTDGLVEMYNKYLEKCSEQSLEAFSTFSLITDLVKEHGYTVEDVIDAETGLKVEGNYHLNIPAGTSNSRILEMFKNEKPDSVIEITAPDGRKKKIDSIAYDQIIVDIVDYIEMKMNNLFT